MTSRFPPDDGMVAAGVFGMVVSAQRRAARGGVLLFLHRARAARLRIANKEGTMEEEKMGKKGLSRRSFLGLGGAALAGAAVAGMAGCAPQSAGSASSEGAGSTVEEIGRAHV